MPSPNQITAAQLSRLIGMAGAPAIVDVRTPADYSADPRLIPGSVRRSSDDVSAWAGEYSDRSVIIVCDKGHGLSQGVAAWMRHEGISAETLEGGFAGWHTARHPLVRIDKLPARDGLGRTVWVTRERPKIDRIACPWLIRRFVDPGAVFLFVTPSEVRSVAERFAATAFDVDGVFWSHRGDRCTFDTMLDELGLDIPALRRLATIVRGADTARPELAPEAAGLTAISLGFSRMFRDDLRQLEAAMQIYDGLYRWCRDATDETHNWSSANSLATRR